MAHARYVPMDSRYSLQTEEVYTVKKTHCRCGLTLFRGRCDGIQRFEHSPSLELRTCTTCGETNSIALPTVPYIRRARCEQLILDIAVRQDIPGHERVRLIQHLLDEMTAAQQETMRGRS